MSDEEDIASQTQSGNSQESRQTDSEWSSHRRAIAYEEARNVIDSQQSNVNDIDDKAMRTVRNTAILLGILISASQISQSNPQLTVSREFAVAGGVLLLASILTSILAYSESDLYQGPDQSLIADLRDNSFPYADSDDWEKNILKAMGYWIDDNAETVRENGQLLFYSQAFLLGGLASISISVAPSVMDGFESNQTGVTVVLIAIGLTLPYLYVRLVQENR